MPGTWIQTHSGVRFELLNPTPKMVRVADIAHHLSHLCRFTGGVSTFYSVAEHAVAVSHLVERETDDPLVILKALHHDSTEAYLGDVSKPLKDLLPAYKRIEARVAAAIFQKLKLTHVPDRWHVADLAMLSAEALYLLKTRRDWKLPVKPAVYPIWGWKPKIARAVFQLRHNQLVARCSR
jgi:hypothetical protein